MAFRDRDRTPIALSTAPPREAAVRWLLHVVFGASAGQVWEVAGGGLLLGRAEAEGVVVLDEGEASRRHAQFAVDGGGRLLVEDLSSTNGTWVDGRRVGEARLSEGAVLRIGRSLLVVGRGRTPLPGPDGSRLLGVSPAIEEVRRLVRLGGPTPLPALVLGPTGTGKELVASGLHAASGRRGELVAVNSAALPAMLVESSLFGHKRGAFTDARSDEPGAFVRANGGTLFLDEIGEMPLEAQAKLLRVLETGEVTPVGSTRPVTVDVRVVAATHRAVGVGGTALREDLHARLAGVVIRTPALRERPEDVLALFAAFLGPAAAAQLPTMPVEVAEALVRYHWPRNVRELKRVAERLELLHGPPGAWRVQHLGLDEVLEEPPAGDDASSALNGPGADLDVPWPPTADSLRALLAECGGNVSLAAERVGRNRKQIYRWCEKLGLD